MKPIVGNVDGNVLTTQAALKEPANVKKVLYFVATNVLISTTPMTTVENVKINALITSIAEKVIVNARKVSSPVRINV